MEATDHRQFVALKELLAGNHFIQNAAQGIDVGWGRGPLTLPHFWGNVVGRPQDTAACRETGIGFPDQLSQTKVT